MRKINTIEGLRIIETDLMSRDQARDLIAVLEAYKTDPMGNSDSYSEEDKIRLIASLKAHRHKLVLLAYMNNKIAAGTVCFESVATFSASPCINIHDICVIPEFRKQGIGRALMNQVLEYAREIKAGKVTLEVRKDNTNARELYRSLGFQKTEPEMLFRTKYITNDNMVSSS